MKKIKTILIMAVLCAVVSTAFLVCSNDGKTHVTISNDGKTSNGGTR